MSIKRPSETDAIPNPLHAYASYTYSWSLWWLDVSDYNDLMALNDAESAMNKKFYSPNTFVVAEDGGIYPEKRQKGTLKLNYHIQSVEFDTRIAPGQIAKASNLTEGFVTIIEPYGITLVDTLIAAAFDGEKYRNYTDQPFMLELKFKGYDDNGVEIPKDELTLYTKRFPIRITEMKIAMSKQGAEYRCRFSPYGAVAFGKENDTAYTPKNFSITAGTVKEFFDELKKQYLDYYYIQVGKGDATFADSIDFKIDDTIAKSKIVNKTKLPLPRANSKADKIDLDKQTFNIPRGSAMLDIIAKVMAHSEYLINLQLGLEDYGNYTDISQTDVFNSFKVLTKAELAGVDKSGQLVEGAFDLRTNRHPKAITFMIHQYSQWSVNHPAAPLFADSNPYIQKYYNYLYTGLNTDVVDISLNFNSTYYTSILAFTSAVAAEESSQDTDVSELVNQGSGISLNPAIFTSFVPQLGLVPNATPSKYKFIVSKPNTTTGMNLIDRPAAQVAADVINSTYTAQTGDMLEVALTIVGDPTLIGQGDWLYVPNPEEAGDFNDWDINSMEYAEKYGHLPFDRHEVIVNLIINSPVDLDIDITNEGLAYPQPAYTQSLFSGKYRILEIKHKFVTGKFEQVLRLARILNSDLTTAFTQAVNNGGRPNAGTNSNNSNSVETGTNNDLPIVPTNPSTPAGDEGDNTPLPILEMSDADRAAAVENAKNQPWTVIVNGDARQ